MRGGANPVAGAAPVSVTMAQLGQIASETDKVRRGLVAWGSAQWPVVDGPGHGFMLFGCGSRVHGARVSVSALRRLRAGRPEYLHVANPGGAWWAEVQLDTARAALVEAAAPRPVVVDVTPGELGFAADLLSSVAMHRPLAVWLVGGAVVFLFTWDGEGGGPAREQHDAGRTWDRDGLHRTSLAGVVATGLLHHAGAG